MNASELSHAVKRPKRRIFLRAVQILLTIFNAWMVIQVWDNQGPLLKMFAIFCIYSLVSFVFRLG